MVHVTNRHSAVLQVCPFPLDFPFCVIQHLPFPVPKYSASFCLQLMPSYSYNISLPLISFPAHVDSGHTMPVLPESLKSTVPSCGQNTYLDRSPSYDCCHMHDHLRLRHDGQASQFARPGLLCCMSTRLIPGSRQRPLRCQA